MLFMGDTYFWDTEHAIKQTLVIDRGVIKNNLWWPSLLKKRFEYVIIISRAPMAVKSRKYSQFYVYLQEKVKYMFKNPIVQSA